MSLVVDVKSGDWAGCVASSTNQPRPIPAELINLRVVFPRVVRRNPACELGGVLGGESIAVVLSVRKVKCAKLEFFFLEFEKKNKKNPTIPKMGYIFLLKFCIEILLFFFFGCFFLAPLVCALYF